MAKMNNNNNKKNNNQNYFSQSIQKDGEEFLRYKSSRDMEFDAPKIFRELARGRINLDNYGHYFLDMTFLNTLITVANKNYVEYNVITQSISFYISSMQNSNMMVPQEVYSVFTDNQKKLNAYQILIHHLMMLNSTKDLTYLYSLVPNLQNFKYVI